jgi:hypothetical protein
MFPLILDLQQKLIGISSYTDLNHYMELMKSMGKLRSKVGERSRQNVEPTPKDEGRKKVMRKNSGKFVPIILGVAWRYILVNVQKDVHSPPL